MQRTAGIFGRIMRTAALALVVAGAAPAAGPAFAQSSIKVIVDDTAITTMDIQGRARLLQIANKLSPAASQKQAVEELIDEAVRMREAARRGVKISDEQVDQAVASIASRSKLSPAQFATALGQAGVPLRALEARLKAQMAWGQIVRARLRTQVRAEQDDLIAQMRRQEKDAGSVKAEDFVLQRVIFTLPKKADAGLVSRRRQEAEQLRARFKGCDAGIPLAKQLREVAVISIGRRLAAEVTPQMAGVLKDVPEGALSKPMQTDEGLEMIAVCQRIEVTGESAASAAGLDAEAMDEQGDKISKDLTRELRQKANIVYR